MTFRSHLVCKECGNHVDHFLCLSAAGVTALAVDLLAQPVTREDGGLGDDKNASLSAGNCTFP